MSMKVAVKLAALLTALTFTICAIFWLNQGHMDSFWTSLGFKSGQRLNWCSERVKSVYFFDDSSKLLEKERKWILVKDGEEKELDYLRVEKWFARYCQIPFEPLSDVDTREYVAAQPTLEVEFIDSQRLTISTLPNEEAGFGIRSRRFKSETLRKGLKELLAFGGEIK